MSAGRPCRLGRATSALRDSSSSLRDGSGDSVFRATILFSDRSRSCSTARGRKAAVETDVRWLALSSRMPVSLGRPEGTALRACPVQFTSKISFTLFISDGQGCCGSVALARGSRARRINTSSTGNHMACRGEPWTCMGTAPALLPTIGSSAASPHEALWKPPEPAQKSSELRAPPWHVGSRSKSQGGCRAHACAVAAPAPPAALECHVGPPPPTLTSSLCAEGTEESSSLGQCPPHPPVLTLP